MEYELKKVGSQFIFDFVKIKVAVRKIRETSNSMFAELEFFTLRENDKRIILNTNLNLLSIRSRNELVGELSEIIQDFDWYQIIKTICERTLEEHRKGEPPEPLSSSDEIGTADFLIDPIIYRNKPNMIYGAGGSFKSFFALLLAVLCQDGEKEFLGMKFSKATPLILDYEGEKNETRRRIKMIEKSLELPPVSILYRQSARPFVDEIDEIEKIVAENNVDFLIIDSLGIACATQSLNEIESANSFFSALRRLPVTSLLITHIAKDILTRQGKRSMPFGSIFFYNFARNIFELKVSREDNPTVAYTGLFHRKNNQGMLIEPMAFEIGFSEGRLKIAPCKVEDIPEFNDEITLKKRMRNLLLHGRMTVKEIAQNLRISASTCRTILNRHPEMFIKIGKEWGVMTRGQGDL